MNKGEGEREVGGGLERGLAEEGRVEGKGDTLSLVECENRDNRFINQIKSMIE